MAIVPRLLFVLVLVLVPVVVWGTGTTLPAQVASHFNGVGIANGWMGRDAYLAFMLALTTLVPLAVAATTGLVPALSRRTSLMRHRDYWLAPPRREDTQRFLGNHACAFGIVLSLFMLGMHLLTVRANATSPAVMPIAWLVALLGVFLALVGAWMAVLFMRFRTPG